MAWIKDRSTGLRTVGAVIDALSKFDRDMPVESGLDGAIEIYRMVPEDHENRWDDERGAINIEGCDPDEDDFDEEE